MPDLGLTFDLFLTLTHTLFLAFQMFCARLMWVVLHLKLKSV